MTCLQLHATSRSVICNCELSRKIRTIFGKFGTCFQSARKVYFQHALKTLNVIGALTSKSWFSWWVYWRLNIRYGAKGASGLTARQKWANSVVFESFQVDVWQHLKGEGYRKKSWRRRLMLGVTSSVSWVDWSLRKVRDKETRGHNRDC